MIGFIGASITITTNYNSSQSVTVYDSLHSLLDHEHLLFHCDERRITAHILDCLGRHLSDESLLRINYDIFITSRLPEYRSPTQTVPLLFFVLSVATKRTSLLLSNRGPTVDCVTSRMCLRKRCLANGHIQSHYYFKYLLTTFLYKLYVRNGSCSRYEHKEQIKAE
jgi:hypothetical protein